MGKGSAQVFNIISIISISGTIIALGIFVGIFLSPPPPPSPAELTQVAASILVLPSITPSATPTITPIPSRTLPPTFTPTPTETLTPTVTLTTTASPTASPTITDTAAPTFTPSLTSTPAATDTPTPTFTPTGATPTFTPSLSPFVFTQRDQVLFTTNFANSAQCAWQGIGGQVIDLNGVPFVGQLVVHVYNNNFDRTVNIGSNSFYGTSGANGENSGFEVQVSNAIDTQLYFVQLETTNGAQYSDTIQVQFPSSCDGNVAIVNFIQTRPLQ